MTASNDTVLEELDHEIARLESDLRTARDMRSWWAARHRNGSTPVATPSAHPQLPVNVGPKKSTTAWIREILSDGARRTAPMIRVEAERGGWTTKSPQPTVIVRNALKEMLKRGEVEKIGQEYVATRSSRIAALA